MRLTLGDISGFSINFTLSIWHSSSRLLSEMHQETKVSPADSSVEAEGRLRPEMGAVLLM